MRRPFLFDSDEEDGAARLAADRLQPGQRHAADLPQPAILLLTENYATGWRALPLEGSAQSTYRILPANYCLRAIPLAAGKHHILVEYAPAGWRIGRWVSLLGLGAYAVAGALALRRSAVPRRTKLTGT